MWSEVSTSVRSLIFVYQNTRRHISDNRHLRTLIYMYFFKLLICLRLSAMDTRTDCNFVSRG